MEGLRPGKGAGRQKVEVLRGIQITIHLATPQTLQKQLEKKRTQWKNLQEDPGLNLLQIEQKGLSTFLD